MYNLDTYIEKLGTIQLRCIGFMDTYNIQLNICKLYLNMHDLTQTKMLYHVFKRNFGVKGIWRERSWLFLDAAGQLSEVGSSLVNQVPRGGGLNEL